MARALVVNSGNANAFTGKRGREAVKLTAEAAAEAVDCLTADVYIASTGVIGEPLDASKIAVQLAALAQGRQARRLRRGRARHHDHRHLSQARHAQGGDRRGRGHDQRHRQGRRHDRARHGDHARLSVHRRGDRAGRRCARSLDPAVDDTFNAITIDGDTSTSDTLLVFATGRRSSRGAPRIADGDDLRLAGFRVALHELMHDLALQIVKDGEGLTKFVTVKVTGRRDQEGRAGHRQVDRQFAAGEDGDRRRGSQLGARSWRRSAKRARRPTATSSPSGSAIFWSPRTARSRPDYREAHGAAYMKGRRSRSASMSAWATASGHGMDLRPHPRLYRHQRRLSVLTSGI